MLADKQIRMNHIFRADGRALIVAMDHGISGLADLGKLAEPIKLIDSVARAGADAIITTPGIARRYAGAFGRLGLILRIDGGPSVLTGQWDQMRVFWSVEDALRAGADAVIMMGIVGAAGEAESLVGMGKIAAECQRWGLPLVAEMLPGGLIAKEVTLDQMRTAVRLGVELGADVIKIRYLGDAGVFRNIISLSYVPVVVLGGTRQPQEKLLSEIGDAIKAGAAGAAVGRNIWQDPDPQAITHSLAEIVHAP